MGVAFFQPDAEVHLHARHYLEGQIRKVPGGRAAEELVFGSAAVTSGASSDLQQATRIAKQMVYKLGNVLQMFHERRSALESLADALLKHETLTGDAASEVLRDAGMTPRAGRLNCCPRAREACLEQIHSVSMSVSMSTWSTRPRRVSELHGNQQIGRDSKARPQCENLGLRQRAPSAEEF